MNLSTQNFISHHADDKSIVPMQLLLVLLTMPISTSAIKKQVTDIINQMLTPNGVDMMMTGNRVDQGDTITLWLLLVLADNPTPEAHQ